MDTHLATILRVNSETQTVFLKCFIQLTDSDIDAVPWIGNRNLEMKRKYQKRKKRSNRSKRNPQRRKRDDHQLTNWPLIRSTNQQFVNCSVYPSHKIIT